MNRRAALTERNQKMLAMREAKKTLKEIAAEFHISIPRVHWIIERERMKRLRPLLVGV